MRNIVIVTIKEWNISNYFKLKDMYKDMYIFHLLTSEDEFNYESLKKLNPKYVFFPHWSSIISKDIYTNFECVVFHMTDLPFGRGGSPLQNLIQNGIYKTKISALKVEKSIDSGDIYIKEDLDISKGSAEEIFINASSIVFNKMIPRFLKGDLTPIKQSGEVTTFKRRKKEESKVSDLNAMSLSSMYDFIRMLDAQSYPQAYLELGNLKIKFSQVKEDDNKLVGRFEVIENE